MNARTEWIDPENRPSFEERILDLATLGDALFQEQVNRVIQMCHKRAIGATGVLTYIPWSGDAYHINRQTPVESARFVDDTDNIDCSDETGCDEAEYGKVSFDFKCILVCGSVTRASQKRGRGYADILALELAHAAEAIVYRLELCTFQGDETANPKEFDGFLTLVQVFNGSDAALPVQVLLGDGGVLSTTPGSSTAGDLILKLLDQVLDELMSGPAAIFVSKAGRRLIRSLLTTRQVFNDTVRVRAGFEVESYFDAPIIITDGVPDTLQIIDDGAGFPEISSLTAGDTTAIVAVNTDKVGYAEWTPITIEPLARCTSQKQRFDGYWDGTLFLDCPEGLAVILNVDPQC